MTPPLLRKKNVLRREWGGVWANDEERLRCEAMEGNYRLRLFSEEQIRRRKAFNEQLERARQEKLRTSRIFVGNLNYTVTYKTLVRVFKACGPIKYANINCFEFRENSTCCAEIVFDDPKAYKNGECLNGLLLEGLALVVCAKIQDLPEWKQQGRSKESQQATKYNSPGDQSLAGSSATIIAHTSTSK
ncbi:hypothetical protein ACEPAF_6561 [Sanghuangporus sanghuang]